MIPGIRSNFDNPVYNWIIDNLSNKLITNKDKDKNNKNNKNNTIILIGHSLGGAIASIVSGRLYNNGYQNVISIALSSPGTLYSSKKFGIINNNILDIKNFNIIPRNDPMTKFDKHSGLQQIIECYAVYTFYCHLSTLSFCEISKHINKKFIRNKEFVNCICKDYYKGITNDFLNCIP